MQTIASVSLSGGQGKSTLVYFLARALATRGYKTLVIDLDPQHNISTFLRVFVEQDEASVFEFLKGETNAESIYPVEDLDNLSLIPADDGLEVTNDFLANSGIGSSDYFLIPVEPEVKGVLSSNRTLSAVAEIVASGVVQTQLLGVLPFRDKWFGLNRSTESTAAIAQMSKLVLPDLILPPCNLKDKMALMEL